MFDLAVPYLVRDSRNQEEDHHGQVGISAYCPDTARRGDCARPERGAVAHRPSVGADEATRDVPGTEGTDQAPASAVALLMKILGSMGAARNVSIIPWVTELSTVHAAGVLNVPQLFPIALLEKSYLPHWTVGKHRKIDMECYLLHGRHRQRLHSCSRSTCR